MSQTIKSEQVFVGGGGVRGLHVCTGSGLGGGQMNKFENKSLCGHMSPSPWTGRPTNTNKTFPQHSVTGGEFGYNDH